MATPAWELIDSNTLSSSASSVTFSAIPQGYRDLVLIVDLDGIAMDALGIRFNGDTGSNYTDVKMRGNGSTTQSATQTDSYIEIGINTAGESGKRLYVTNIMDYSATDKHKSVLSRGNSSGNVVALAGRWANTSAITSLSVIEAFSAGFTAGDTFYLWGLNRL